MDEPGLMVIGEASNGNQAIALARELKPDVILMDILMPEMDGIAATARIKAEMPKVEIIALTSVLQDHSVSQAIQAGATGYGNPLSGRRKGAVVTRGGDPSCERVAIPRSCRTANRSRDRGLEVRGGRAVEQGDCKALGDQ